MGEGWRKPWMRMREKSAMSDKGYVGTGRDRDDSSGLSETHMTLTSRHETCFACSQSRSNPPRGAGLGQVLVGSVPHTLFFVFSFHGHLCPAFALRVSPPGRRLCLSFRNRSFLSTPYFFPLKESIPEVLPSPIEYEYICLFPRSRLRNAV